MSKTRTHHISFNGFQIILNHPFAIFHQRDLKWPLPSLETQLPSKKCSRESLNNSLLCSEERLSSIGTLDKVWTKCNSLKLNQTWTTSSQNINNIKMLPQNNKDNSNNSRHDPIFIIPISQFLHIKSINYTIIIISI